LRIDERRHGEEDSMQVRQVMSKKVRITAPTENLQTAARLMAEADVGALPVGENDRLIGMITDRDIVVRGLGTGRDPSKTSIRDIMSDGIDYCFDYEDVDQVAAKMSQLQERRLPVLNRAGRLVGIVSLGDISRRAGSQISGGALRRVSEPTGPSRPTRH
jgi:CBS domain-containing protein